MKHRFANHFLEFDSRLQFHVHLRPKEPNAIAATGLRPVEGEIGAFQQPLGAVAIPARKRDTDADRHYDVLFFEPHWSGASCREAARKILGLILVADFGLYNDEFVAA